MADRAPECGVPIFVEREWGLLNGASPGMPAGVAVGGKDAEKRNTQFRYRIK